MARKTSKGKWYKVCKKFNPSKGCMVRRTDIPGNINMGTYKIMVKNKKITKIKEVRRYGKEID